MASVSVYVSTVFSCLFLTLSGCGTTVAAACSSYTCGGILNASNSLQELTSPGYPVSYPNNCSCTWSIRAPAQNDMIRIVVLDSTLENEMECKYDSVKVYDGFNASSRHINTWCGTMTPTVQSKSSSMTLHFSTNSNRTYTGFRLRYYATTEHYHCGANLTAKVSPQYLTTPGYPNMYQNEARCRWIIEAPGDNTVQMRVIDSNIENQLFCRYDWARVLDGNSLTSPKLGVFCGFMTPSYNSTGKYLLIEFHSDSARTFKGFKIQYTTEDDQSNGHRLKYNIALLAVTMSYQSLWGNL